MLYIEQFPEFGRVLTDMGLDAESLRKHRCILSGQTISEYYLAQKGILKEFRRSLISVTGYEDFEELENGTIDLYSRHSIEKVENKKYLEELDILKKKGYDKKVLFHSIISPINLYNIVYFEGQFIYNSEFLDLVSTRQLRCKNPNLDTAIQMFQLSKNLPKGLYINLEKELLRVVYQTEKIKDKIESKEYSVGEDLESYLELSKYFGIELSKKKIKIRNSFYLKKEKHPGFSVVKKSKKTRNFLPIHPLYFDLEFGDVSKICNHNYTLLRESNLIQCIHPSFFYSLKKQISLEEKSLLEFYYATPYFQNKQNLSFQRTVILAKELKKRNAEYGKRINLVCEQIKSVKRAKIEEFLNERIKFYNPENPIYRFLKSLSDEYSITELNTKEELIREGIFMKHCIGNYSINSHRKYFHLRYQNESSTIELFARGYIYSVSQHTSFQNTIPHPKLKELGQKLCSYINFYAIVEGVRIDSGR